MGVNATSRIAFRVEVATDDHSTMEIANNLSALMYEESEVVAVQFTTNPTELPLSKDEADYLRRLLNAEGYDVEVEQRHLDGDVNFAHDLLEKLGA